MDGLPHAGSASSGSQKEYFEDLFLRHKLNGSKPPASALSAGPAPPLATSTAPSDYTRDSSMEPPQPKRVKLTEDTSWQRDLADQSPEGSDELNTESRGPSSDASMPQLLVDPNAGIQPDTGLPDNLKQIFNTPQYATVSLPPAPQPLRVASLLLQHQRVGLAWLLEQEKQMHCGILADDMGLGKTLMTLSLVAENKLKAPTLIVCPVSTVDHWTEEMEKHLQKGFFRFSSYHGSKRIRNKAFLQSTDIVVTTYGTVSSEAARKNSAILKHIKWGRIILDEAHVIKNDKTLTAKAVCELEASHMRLCITGTPIQNDIDDLFSILHFLRFPGLGTDHELWRHTISLPIRNKSPEAILKLQEVLRQVLLRRRKDTLIDGAPIINLPSVTYELHQLEMNAEERAIYDGFEKRFDGTAQVIFDSGDQAIRNNYWHLLVFILRLRQICDHPLLLITSKISQDRRRHNIDILKNIHQCLSSGTVQDGKELQKFVDSLVDDTSKADICSICSGDVVAPVLASCGHVFCQTCLDNHSELSTQCPRCGTKLSRKKMQSLSEDAERKPVESTIPMAVPQKSAGELSTDEAHLQTQESVEPKAPTAAEGVVVASSSSSSLSSAYGPIATQRQAPRPLKQPKKQVLTFAPKVTGMRPAASPSPASAEPEKVSAQVEHRPTPTVSVTDAKQLPSASAPRATPILTRGVLPQTLAPSAVQIPDEISDESDSDEAFANFSLNLQTNVGHFDEVTPELVMYDSGRLTPLRLEEMAPSLPPTQATRSSKQRDRVMEDLDDTTSSLDLLPSSKIAELIQALQDMREQDPTAKAVVYSQFVGFLDLIEKKMNEAYIGFSRLDGSMLPQERRGAIDRLRSSPTCIAILVSLKAGGVGINLTAASHVFLMDPWWNPMIEQQAIDRVHRIGQKKKVFVHRLIFKNSIEERISMLQEKKKRVAEAVLGNGDISDAFGQLSIGDLKLLLRSSEPD